MKKLFVCLLLSIVTVVGYSQSSSLKGVLVDTFENKSLSNAVISLLKSNDSALVAFTRADKDGKFSINNIKPGNYLVMVTHPYLGDRFEPLDLTDGSASDLGKVYMIPKMKLLTEVIIKSGSPIRIKGDTTIYTADSFKVRAGANVEELLRRLPGIQVDQNGEITAMGERVKKVLVDGEEFFGSDPGIATKNLRADKVKEVQVFDKKSDQAEFTGIDDGVRDKTINLKMKEMKGYFGKVEAGGGLNERYNSAIMLNAFQAKRKLAGYGIMSNTGQTNLDWKDAQNYAGGGDVNVMDDGGVYISFGGGGDEESYWGGRNGIPTNKNAGLHYSNKFYEGKLSFNSGYKFSRVNAPGVTTTFSQSYLPDSIWSGSSTNENFSSTDKHAFNVTVDMNIDSANSLKWTARFNNNTSRNESDFYSQTLNENNEFINNSTRRSNNKSDRNNIATSLLWRYKFKKISRTLSINTDFNWAQSKNNGLLYSLNNFYKDGQLLERDTTDQMNIQNSDAKGITTKVAYTEPLLKDMYLEISHSISYNSNINDRFTNTKDINGKYEVLVDTLSNSFEFNRLVNTPGLNFRVNKKKYNFSFGSAVGFSHFVQKNITENETKDYDYVNFFPRANFNFKPTPSENIRFNYNGSTSAPSLEQLQPTRINTDPFNVYIGNPGLRQSFRHSFSGGYNSYSVLKEKNIWSNISFNFTENAFVQSSTLDSVGKRTYQTVNANGVYNINLYGNYGLKVTKAKIGIGFGPIANYSRSIDFVNDQKNVTKNSSYGIRLNIDKYVQNKYNFYFGPSFTWRNTEASINKFANAEYWQFDAWANGTVTLPKNFELATNFNIQIRQKDPRFPDNNSFTTWNASITRRMLKDNALEIKFSVNDILGQNRGYNRNFNSYSFTETYYNTLKRFWLLTVTWNLSKNGKPAGFN